MLAVPLTDSLSADTAYDADLFRHAEYGATAETPNNPSRAKKHPLDKHLDAQRHLVECCFNASRNRLSGE